MQFLDQRTPRPLRAWACREVVLEPILVRKICAILDLPHRINSQTVFPLPLRNVKFPLMKVTVVDPILKMLREQVNSQLTYEGSARGTSALTSDPVWQIKRTLVQGNLTTVEYAGEGYFNQVWDSRASLFPSPVFTNPASLNFDGTNERIALGDNYTFGPSIAFSWSVWLKAQNLAAQRAFIAKVTSDANVYGYSFQHTATGKLFAQVRAPGTLTSHTFSTTLSAGAWYHICFTYSGSANLSGLTAYINGVTEGSPASAALGAWTVSDALVLGARGSGFYFSGNLNHASVWNKALSPSEVTELYNAGSPSDLDLHSASANLSSWWFLNTASNFPTEVDQRGTVNGTLENMEASDYTANDVP